ncbi:unnamed protein product [Staurois parvus]|uniref:Uncharacterized protein n=1 Tax=Staurois parvus TaxID=386267 RepID=A0ABN9GDH5_9NEOB|nr:unnamed protein product [Staurois parvus]
MYTDRQNLWALMRANVNGLQPGAQIMGPPGNRGSWGPCPCPNSKKPMKKVPGASHGAPY